MIHGYEHSPMSRVPGIDYRPSRDGGAAFCAGGHLRLLAGVSLHGGLRGSVGRHHGVSRDQGSRASRAAHEGGADGGKGDEPKDHHVFALLGFVALLVVPALDRRFMWSPVPPYVSLIGDFLVALGFLLVYFVIRENSYAASTIQVAGGQTVISTGPYAVVRHPMYAGTLPLLIGTPLALGSWSGLIALAWFMPALIWRLLDEERFLHEHLLDTQSILGKCGIDCCRLSGRSTKKHFTARKPKS